MSRTININEIGPRDGFQNVKAFISTETKLNIIDGLVESGIRRIQFTSFVNPKAIPQMADASTVARVCLEKYKDRPVEFYALVPNLKGAILAAACGVKAISYVTSVSESHNQANIRKSVDESVEELRLVLESCSSLQVSWDIATAFGCPFEGPISYDQLQVHVEKGHRLGIRSFTLCDTIGIAHPRQVRDTITRILGDFPDSVFSVHIHDTRNMGMVNTLAAVECGIQNVEVAIGGLGGCPFAPGASGNTSTEDFVYMVNQMGFDTGVDFDSLLSTAKYAKQEIDGNFSGHHVNITKDCRTQL